MPKFFGAHVSALIVTNFGCASSLTGAELGAQVVKEARNQVSNLHFLGALSQLYGPVVRLTVKMAVADDKTLSIKLFSLDGSGTSTFFSPSDIF